MSRTAAISQECTYRQFHRNLAALPRNRRKTYVLLPDEQRPMTVVEQLKLGIVALPFIACAFAYLMQLP